MLSDDELTAIKRDVSAVRQLTSDATGVSDGACCRAWATAAGKLLDEIDRLNKVIFDRSDDLAAKGWDGDYDALQKHSGEQQEEIERLQDALIQLGWPTAWLGPMPKRPVTT